MPSLLNCCKICCPSPPPAKIRARNRSKHKLKSDWASVIYNFENDISAVRMVYEDTPYVLNQRINRNGDTALHIALKKDNIELAKFLLDRNCDIHILNNEQQSAGSIAVVNGNRSLHQLLYDRNMRMQLHNMHDRSSTCSMKLMSMCESEIDDDDSEIRTEASFSVSMISNFVGEDDGLSVGGDEKKVDALFVTNNNSSEIDIELIVKFLCAIPNREIFWDKIFGKPVEEITRSKELFKLVYALVFASLRMRDIPLLKSTCISSKPSIEASKKLTKKLKKRIKRGREYFVLSKMEFVSNFHHYLYDINSHANVNDNN